VNRVKICALRSGSSGNAIFVGNGRTRLLIDAGVSLRDIEHSLTEIGESAAALTAVLLTHEHTDHARSIGALLRRHHIPLYTSAGTLGALGNQLGRVSDSLLHTFRSEESFAIGDLGVTAFPTSHDAAESVAFRIGTGQGDVAICTDLGWPEPRLLQTLSGCRTIFVEANYDPVMLAAGTYPPLLKQRIASDLGHLSNPDSAHAIIYFLARGTEQFILAHLSKENNYPELALQTVEDHLRAEDALIGRDLDVAVARRFTTSEPIIW
jgi:phosphoribosyl 1,2-cyclic phosphodiesterase